MGDSMEINVRLNIIAAEGLSRAADLFRLPDPFVVVMVDEVHVKTTATILKTSNPRWNESFDFTASKVSKIKITVHDQKKFKKKDQGLLGWTWVDLATHDYSSGVGCIADFEIPSLISKYHRGKIFYDIKTTIPQQSTISLPRAPPMISEVLSPAPYIPAHDTSGKQLSDSVGRVLGSERQNWLDEYLYTATRGVPGHDKPLVDTARATDKERPESKSPIEDPINKQQKVLSRLAEDHIKACTYFLQEDYHEAEVIFLRVATEREAVLGSLHLDTLQSKLWLGVLQHKGNRNFKAAERYFRQAANGYEILLGNEHQDTLFSKMMLGTSLFDQKKFFEAERPLQQALAGLERTLGAINKTTLFCRNILGTTLCNQRKYKEAESQLQLAAEGHEKLLGSNHENTIATISLLQALRADFAALSIESPSVQSPILENAPPENGTDDDVSNLSTSGLITIKQSKTSHRNTDQRSTTQSTNSQSTLVSRLALFFPEGEEKKQIYNDLEISEISVLLKHSNASWGKVPRTYIVLRTIGQLNFLDQLIDLGFSDYWFPVTDRNLPKLLSPSIRAEFLDAQSLVLTKSMDLEKAENGNHCHFKKGEPLPFEPKEVLGKGGYGQVDKVLSLISFKEYARKRVPRSTAFKGRRLEDMKQFIAEIQILKRLKHHHIVEFVGSYTDSKHIGLIMSPVAEVDLSTYLKGEDKNAELRTFFGCLATALKFLHDEKIRHKDIKPSNILVKGGNVFFTDFGLSMDFTDATGSTTVSMVNGMTPKYCAPEVAQHQPRNTASDIWSLGIVFLEMVVALKGRTGQDMDDFFSSHGSQQLYVRTNLVALREFITELQGVGEASDNVVLGWVQNMLLEEQQFRPSAEVLLASILLSENQDEPSTFCGLCCISSEEDDFDELDEE